MDGFLSGLTNCAEFTGAVAAFSLKLKAELIDPLARAQNCPS
jgi:hypothetical protein